MPLRTTIINEMHAELFLVLTDSKYLSVTPGEKMATLLGLVAHVAHCDPNVAAQIRLADAIWLALMK